MEKAFTRVNWENTPSMATPLNEDNLNEGDAALDIIDDRVISLDLTKANQSDLLQTVKTITYNTTTGVFVFTWWNGTSLNVDLNIEKIPVTFSMDANGVITMTTADGTTYTADVGSLIKQYSFVDSSEIDFTVTVDAQTGDKSVTASIKDGSITGQKLQPNYLADITTQATNASNSATSASGSATNAHADAQLAQSYAVGTGGTVRTGDATDNAKYYKEQAEQAAADAQAAAHVSTMTLSTNGIGRPDGTTITVDANGVFTATSGQTFIYPDPNVLPSASTANDKAIYLIDDPTASGADICTEWVVVTTNGVKTWKQIGDTSVDLSGYATTTQLNTKVNKTNLASIEATGTTNATGSTIDKDTYFWLNGNFVQALTDIAVNATFTANSNYKVANDVLNEFEGGSSGSGSSEDIEAIVNVYGAKNLNSYPYFNTTKSVGGFTYTDNEDGTITAEGTFSGIEYYAFSLHSAYSANNSLTLKRGRYILNGCPSSGSANTYYIKIWVNNTENAYLDTGEGVEFEVTTESLVHMEIHVYSGVDLSTPIIFKPMIRDARISDTTYVPYAMTNKDLTDKKVNKTDISSIQLTGTTNTSGSTITAGTWFYLNGELCKAKVDIASNATFTLNTNYEKKPLSEGDTWEIGTTTLTPLSGSAFSVGYCMSGSMLMITFNQNPITKGSWVSLDYPSTFPPSKFSFKEAMWNHTGSPYNEIIDVGIAATTRRIVAYAPGDGTAYLSGTLHIPI